MRTSLPFAIPVLCTLAALGGATSSAQQAGTPSQPAASQPTQGTGGAALSIWDGVYSEAQARRGLDRYKASCATCHAEDLMGGSGPALVGEAFMQRWNGSSVGDMLQSLRQTMPQDAPDSLGLEGYTDLVAYLLERNSAPAGQTEMAPNLVSLGRLRIVDRPSPR